MPCENLSGEWHALAGEALREQIAPDKMKNISTSMSNIYKNCPEEDIGFRYENPIVIKKDCCEELSKYPLGIEEI